LFAAASQFTLQPHIDSDLGYNPFSDFIPISQVVKFDQALAVSRKLPIGSISELIAWLKANPAQAMYGSPGAGTVPCFTGLEFARLTGLPLSHVAYRGTSAALADLLTGRIPLYIAAPAELIEQHKSGGVRIIAIAADTRSPLLPGIPTLRESAIDLDAPAWFALYAAAGTPREVVERLETEVAAATRAQNL